jgi:hypothetical protein
MVASESRHRRHRRGAEADQLAVEYEASGLSQIEFCQQRDLPLKTLGRYLTRYRKQAVQGNEPHKPQRFVAVEVARPGCGGGELTVLLPGGLRVEVKPGFDAGTLRQLIAVLEA